MAPASPLPVVLDGVSVRSGGVTLLDGVDAVFAPGPPTVLIGPNGAGKSSVLRVAMGLLRPEAGRASWGGRATPEISRIAIVFQRPVMLRRSAAANLAYALSASGVPRRERPGRIAALLARVGLEGLGDRPARRLSGGEQQRLALARALARDPALLLLDEPTASLDPAATRAVEEIVRGIAAEGVKVVMATHDLGQARRLAGDAILMVRGRVAEAGPAETLFGAPASREAAAFLAGDLVL